MDTMRMNADQNEQDETWIRSFFMSDVVADSDSDRVRSNDKTSTGNAALEKIEEAIDLALDRMEAANAVELYYKAKEEQDEQKNLKKKKNSKKKVDDNASLLSKPTVLSSRDARTYQLALLERCKQQNAIVHLGTGMGKTFIAIMLIQHYLNEVMDMG